MKIIPNTTLKVHPDKPAYPAGKEADVKKDIAEGLLKRGLATLPVIEIDPEPAADDAAGTGDEVAGD